jgi:hypothetical protein
MQRRYATGVSSVAIAWMHRFRHGETRYGWAVRPSGEIGDLSLGKWGRDSTLRGVGMLAGISAQLCLSCCEIVMIELTQLFEAPWGLMFRLL